MIESLKVVRRCVRILIFLLFAGLIPFESSAQDISKNYANHEGMNKRVVAVTQYFKFVYPPNFSNVIKKAVPLAEHTYERYKRLLGLAPNERIIIYFKQRDQIISASHALNVNSSESLWQKNIFLQCITGKKKKWRYLLRYEIAYAFQQAAHASKLGLWQYLLSLPAAKSPWSVALPSFLALPGITQCEIAWLSKYWNVKYRIIHGADSYGPLKETILGRSQLRYFLKTYSPDSLKSVYTLRQSVLGISYFNFYSAFLRAVNIPYLLFVSRWKKEQFQIYNEPKRKKRFINGVKSRRDSLFLGSKETESEQTAIDGISSQPYHSFFDIAVDRPVVLPYYLNTSDFGLGGVMNWQSPLRMHQFLFAGILSIPSVSGKSIFYTSYVNNTLGPRLKVSFRHYASASGFLDLGIETSNVAALSSLWKIEGWSKNNSNWYAGIMFRHLSVDYYSNIEMPDQPTIVFDNKYNRQTDLRLSLAWRYLAPTPYNLVHPLNGHGLKFTATGSGLFINPDTEYARLYLEGFMLFPAIGKQRIYLYGAGAFDVGESMGRDYLAFSDDGDFELPEPEFIGSISPDIEGHIRGYDFLIAGERFLWGSFEYRIPLILNDKKLLFGFLPSPGIGLALFVDGGVMGEARSFNRSNYTAYRLSLGAELNSALSFEGYDVAFGVGIAQPVDQSFGPQIYFTVQPAIPF